ncbi:MAG TPA: hypothetical protein VFT43_05195, partial [Candidatus Polarisedimenticolia bacterium]|nr:hypothetical protein [Candidatus Polarisedimenticolia bacterium]
MPPEAEIFTALQRGDTARLATLLDADPSLVNARNPAGDSPLLVAAYTGRKALVEALLQRRPEVSLFEAAALGLSDRVR